MLTTAEMIADQQIKNRDFFLHLLHPDSAFHTDIILNNNELETFRSNWNEQLNKIARLTIKPYLKQRSINDPDNKPRIPARIYAPDVRKALDEAISEITNKYKSALLHGKKYGNRELVTFFNMHKDILDLIEKNTDTLKSACEKWHQTNANRNKEYHAKIILELDTIIKESDIDIHKFNSNNDGLGKNELLIFLDKDHINPNQNHNSYNRTHRNTIQNYKHLFQLSDKFSPLIQTKLEELKLLLPSGKPPAQIEKYLKKAYSEVVTNIQKLGLALSPHRFDKKADSIFTDKITSINQELKRYANRQSKSNAPKKSSAFFQTPANNDRLNYLANPQIWITSLPNYTTINSTKNGPKIILLLEHFINTMKAKTESNPDAINTFKSQHQFILAAAGLLSDKKLEHNSDFVTQQIVSYYQAIIKDKNYESGKFFSMIVQDEVNKLITELELKSAKPRLK